MEDDKDERKYNLSLALEAVTEDFFKFEAILGYILSLSHPELQSKIVSQEKRKRKAER